MTQEKSAKAANWTQSALLGIILSILLFIDNISWQERKDRQAERKEFRELIYENASKDVEQDGRIINLEEDNKTIKQKLGGI